jgi:uncharacterized protein
MIKRVLHTEIMDLAASFPCVAILGPRQTGKTTLAKALAKQLKKDTIYLDVEKPSDALKLQDAEAYFNYNKHKCIIIDEIQFMPHLFSILRPAIDAYKKPNRFIITGSASPALVKGVAESLAGRIAYTELTPIGLMELPKKISLQKHWFLGGFPDAITAANYVKAKQWLDNFIKSYIERDLNQLFHIELSTSLIKNFWRMLANNNSGIWNSESYARALSVTGPTTNRYLDYLEGAYLVRRLYPWYNNANKRLVKSPKVYIRDSGLLHRLADVESVDTLSGNVLIGASWEGYVIEQIIQVLPNKYLPFFYRTQDGAEVDLLLVKGNKVHIAIEIKLHANASPKRGFYESIKVLQPKHSFVLSMDSDYYPTKENVYFCNLKYFLTDLLPKI